MKKILLCWIVGVACTVMGQTSPRRGAQRSDRQSAGASSQFRQPSQKGRYGAVDRRASGTTDRNARKSGDGEMSSQDEKLIDSIGEADSLEQLMPLVQKAKTSRSAEVRQAMVSALESRGRDCVDSLAEFINDQDSDVADSAFSAWSNVLSDMKADRRVTAIRSAAQILGNRAAYPGQGYPAAQGHFGQGYPTQGYPAQGQPGQGYPAQGQPRQGHNF